MNISQGEILLPLLRIIGSCTAYLEEIASEEEKIRNLDTTSWRLVNYLVFLSIQEVLMLPL